MNAIASHLSGSPVSLAEFAGGSSPMHTASEISMGQLSLKRRTVVAKFGHLSADPERVADFMRALHPQKTAELVAAETGMSVAAARKLLTRGGGLSFANFIRMISAYGPAFLCAVMPRVPAWLDEAAARAEQARLEAHLAEVSRRIEAGR